MSRIDTMKKLTEMFITKCNRMLYFMYDLKIQLDSDAKLNF